MLLIAIFTTHWVQEEPIRTKRVTGLFFTMGFFFGDVMPLLRRGFECSLVIRGSAAESFRAVRDREIASYRVERRVPAALFLGEIVRLKRPVRFSFS
jgi:hypothetical protein